MTVKQGHLFTTLRTSQGRKEVQDYFIEDFKKGHFSVAFTDGIFVNHIAINSFSPVGACGRVGDKISSDNIPTLIGKMCSKCERAYKEAFLIWFEEREQALSNEEGRAELGVRRIRHAINSDKNWYKDFAGIDI